MEDFEKDYSMSKRIYISGKISGLCREEYTANFAKAEEMLKKDGYRVVNPTRSILSRWPFNRWAKYKHYLIYDIWLLLRCDYIYKLPGWRESRGAQIESCVAFNMKIYTLPLKVRDAYDKKMAKAMAKNHEEFSRKNLVIVKPETDPPTPPKK